jgi:hypothetical protein
MPASVRTYPPDLFDAPRSEPAKAADVLDRMAAERREWLERMRAELVRVYRNRVAFFGEHDLRSYVTADDARRIMETRPGFALPAGASPNLLGSLFRAPGWERSRHRDHQSSTTGSHGNDLFSWRYVGPGDNAR